MIFKCINCGAEYPVSPETYLCPICSQNNDAKHPPLGVLQTVYDYNKLKTTPDLFSYLETEAFLPLLPVNHKQSFSSLRVGKTPMYEFKLGNKTLFLKDDSQNPTYSYKDRASNLVSAFAKENKITTIATASTGNAGSSLAGICASQGQQAIIFVPASAPKAKLTQIMMYGATLVPVEGTYDDCFELSIAASKQFGWYNRNTAYNPLTIEGKKTASYEIFTDMHKQAPDFIFVPVGDGVIISGIYRGFEDLLKLGIINKIPTIVAVQSAGSSNLVGNLGSNQPQFSASNTIADSIAVDVPRNYYMAKKFLEKYEGKGVIVKDSEILEAASDLSQNYGLFTEPASAAAYAGYQKYAGKFGFPKNSKIVIQLTGSGLKDLDAVKSISKFPRAIKPKLNEVEKFLEERKK